MKKLLKTIICIVIGLFMIPALYALGMTFAGTVFAFIANPKAMVVILLIFLVLSFPGMMIIGFIKK